MKAEIYDPIKTLVSISVDGINFPEGTLGAVVEIYSDPERYVVDLAIPDNQLVGGFRYYNVVLTHEQFRLIEGIDQDEIQALFNIFNILEVCCQDALVKNKVNNFYTNTIKLKFFKSQWRKLLKILMTIYYVLLTISFFFAFYFRFFNIVSARDYAINFLFSTIIIIIIYIIVLVYYSWKNSKTKQENIRKNFTKFKEEYDLIYLTTEDTKTFKTNLYNSCTTQNEFKNNFMKRKKQYVKKLRKNYREDLQEIADYFKDKQKEVKKRSSYFQKATPPIGFCFVLLTWLLLGQDFFKNLSDVPLIKVYGLPAFFAITFFPLITLLFEMDTLLLKIYEECINILERALK